MNTASKNALRPAHEHAPVRLGPAKRLTRASFVGSLTEANGLRYSIG
ncbi:hypothetical protein [Sphingomonas oryzagri]